MADTKISAFASSAPLDGTEIVALADGAANGRATIADIATYMSKKIAGNSGAAGAEETVMRLTANATNNTVTLAAFMTVTGVGAGSWHVYVHGVCQSAATTTGIAFAVNHTGTATSKNIEWSHFDTGTAASTGNLDHQVGGTSQIVAGMFNDGTLNTALIANGFGLANADARFEIQAMLNVTVSGSLEILFASEVAASQVLVGAETFLVLKKVS